MDAALIATDSLLINIVLLIGGLGFLIKGSDWFVEASAFIARHYNVSQIIIGLTLVSIGTSLPELATSAYASTSGEGSIALGNVVGSNITNICLILGIGVVCSGKMITKGHVISRDGIAMLISFVITAVICIGDSKTINRFESIGLLLLAVLYIIILFKTSKPDELTEEAEEAEHKLSSMKSAVFFFIIGMIAIFGGSRIVVDTVVKTALDLNMDKGLIAATIVAFGTSVPELAVTVTSVIKKSNDLALGNIIGSCIFNILLVVGVSGVISPITISTEMSQVLIPAMVVVGILLMVFMKTKNQLTRIEGYTFLLLYLGFIAYNITKLTG